MQRVLSGCACPSRQVCLLPLSLSPGLVWGARGVQPPTEPCPPPLQGRDPDGLFTEADIVACVLDMVMAGTETTSATLQWAALLMGKHPSVQGGCRPRAGLTCPSPRGGGPPGQGRQAPRDAGTQPIAHLQTGCRRNWTACWGQGGAPGRRTSGLCPTPTRCCTRCRGSSPCCPTCPAARRPTPHWAATCSPRWDAWPAHSPEPAPHPPTLFPLSLGGGGPWVPDARAQGGGRSGPSGQQTWVLTAGPGGRRACWCQQGLPL